MTWWLRLLPMVAVPVALAASTYPGRYSVPPVYWVLAMCATTAFVIGDRYPLPVTLVVSTLAGPMFAIDAWGLASLVPYLGAVCLAEVAIRSSRPTQLVFAAAVWAAAYTAGSFASDYVSPAAAATSTALFVGGPILIGLYIRAQRDIAATYRQRAVDIENVTRATERSAVARELHDVVAHHMAAIVLQVGIARHLHHDVPPQIRSVLDAVHTTSADALANIRALLTALRDPTLAEVTFVAPENLRTELESVVDRTRSAGFNIDSRFDGPVDRLDAISCITVLRIFQEAMTNVMKHASASATVTTEVRAKDDGVEMKIVNGRRSAVLGTTGQGIIGMSERVDLVNGCLRTDSDGDRWVLDAWVPHPSTPATS